MLDTETTLFIGLFGAFIIGCAVGAFVAGFLLGWR